jgi:hypothetical protein
MAILTALGDAAARSTSGDVIVFYYSGHGSIFPDDLSDVRDETNVLPKGPFVARAGKYDAALCPADTGGPSTNRKVWENLILDDELYEIFSPLTAKGVTVIVLSDCCHSGSLGRELAPEEKIRFLEPGKAVKADLALEPHERALPLVRAEALGKSYLAIGGCRDNQVSKDTGNGGLFTTALLAVIKEQSRSRGDAVTYRDVYEMTRQLVLRVTDQAQDPSLDERFWGAGLDVPMFSPAVGPPPVATAPPAPPASSPVPVVAAATPSAPVATTSVASSSITRVAVRIRDKAGLPIVGAVFAVLSPSVPAGQQKVTRDGSLLLGRTNEKGLYDSGKIDLAPGSYRAMVAAAGYRTFDGNVILTHSIERGTAILAFDLDKE